MKRLFLFALVGFSLCLSQNSLANSGDHDWSRSTDNWSAVEARGPKLYVVIVKGNEIVVNFGLSKATDKAIQKTMRGLTIQGRYDTLLHVVSWNPGTKEKILNFLAKENEAGRTPKFVIDDDKVSRSYGKTLMGDSYAIHKVNAGDVSVLNDQGERIGLRLLLNEN